MTELAPSPRRVTDSYDPHARQRIFALTETEQRVSAENVRLFQALAALERRHTELERRMVLVRAIAARWTCDTEARQILNIIDGK